MRKLKPDAEASLPSVELCAVMAYENLKDDRRTDRALAWSLLGLLVKSLDDSEDE